MALLSRTIKKTVLVLLKLVVSGSLLYLVIKNTGINEIVSSIRQISAGSFATAVLLYILSIYLSSIRWRLLLPEGHKTGRLFSLYLIGSFFNHLLPGIVGGDAVKAYYLSRELKNSDELRVTSNKFENIKKMQDASFTENSSLVTDTASHPSHVVAIASVFMDRYIGFAALMLIGLFAFPFGLKYFAGSYIEWILPLTVFLFVMGSFIVFGLKIGRRFRLLAGLYSYFSLYMNKRPVIVRALFLSIALQIFCICAVYILSIGLNIHIPVMSLFIFIPVISAISTLPVSISGIGVREASFVLLFGSVGITPAQATAISFAWFLSMVTGSLIGFIEYLRFKKKREFTMDA